ncbi:MAG: adenylate/guanylate cyclase domain-containing protein [Gammaproteobacteria bacterium]|nr:adenylate/guanylate cyclase domain-containing protein [Gammaproteobacteria bacterium]
MSKQRKIWAAALLLGLFAVLDLGAARITAPLDYALRDVFLRAEADSRAPAPGIVLINIDERSLELMASEYGLGRWPWSRAVHAELLEKVLAQNPKAVVFDILFSEWDEVNPEADVYFVETATASDRVFFPIVLLEDDGGPGLPLDQYGYKLGFDKTSTARPGAEQALIPSLQPLSETGRVGAINFTPDADGVGRRYAVRFDRAGWRIPSLPARVADFLAAPVPEQPFIDLHWSAGPYDREQYSYVDVFAGLAEGDPMFDGLFEDTVVIIGGTASSLYDIRVTPISVAHPGADILATALSNLLRDDWLRYQPHAGLLASLLLLLAVTLLYSRQHGLLLAAAVLLLGSVLWLISARYLLGSNLLLPTLPPLLYPTLMLAGLTLYSFQRSRQERRQAMETFSRFIDPRVAASLVAEGGSPLATKPESREITILFSDIRGFTTLSESRSPEEVLDLLNRYFDKQVEVIFRHGGTIDKFIGDAIMAFWGAPLDDERQAEHAIEAAMEMAQVVDEFRKDLGDDLAAFDIGIGLHTGPAVVGFIGSDNRLEYTAIGDAVNLASRLEGQTKGRARILVSDDTRRRAGELIKYRAHGEVQVKGRQKAVQLYEPIGKFQNSSID